MMWALFLTWAACASVGVAALPGFSMDPVAGSVLETSFMLRLSLEEPGTVYYSVLPAGGDAEPSALEIRLQEVPGQIGGGNIYAPIADSPVSAEIFGLPSVEHRQLDVFLVSADVQGNLAHATVRLPVDLADYTEPSFLHGYPKLVSVGSEFANFELGLDEPGFVYYLIEASRPGSEPNASILPHHIRECALQQDGCQVGGAVTAGRVEVGQPAVGQRLPDQGRRVFQDCQLSCKPGNYWLHFAAEDDEEKPNLMRSRNMVRRKLASVLPPTWSDKGDDPYYVQSLKDSSDPIQGYTEYVDPGIRATNPTVSIDITDEVITTHNVDTSMPGTYTVNYEVTYLDTTNNEYVTGYESRTVIVTGPWSPAYKGYANGLNEQEGNLPGSCCEWYRTCRLEDFLFDCTQDIIDGCSASDTTALCVICLQLDAFVEAGWGYSKFTKTKPEVSNLGQDAAFIGYVPLDEKERQKAMGNLPGLAGPKKMGYFEAPVHHLEKTSGKAQRSEALEAMDSYVWQDRLVDSRADLLANHNVARRMLAQQKGAYLNGYSYPDNVRHRNRPDRFNIVENQGVFVKPKFAVCKAVRYQCTSHVDSYSGLCLPQDGPLRPWEYERSQAAFAKNEVRNNILQQHLDEKVKHEQPQWQR